MDREVLVVMSARSRSVILILVDALPWPLADEEAFLSDVAPYSGPLETVLGYSGAALPTLLSGKMPSEHGHWTMYRRDPVGSPFRLYSPLLRLAEFAGVDSLVRRFVERALPVSSGVKGYFKLYDVPLGLLPHFSLAETRDIFSPGGLGNVRTIFDELRERDLSYKAWTWRTSEEESFRQALHAIRNGDAKVLFLYTAELDAVMHAHGVFSQRARAKLRELEERIASLYSAAQERYGDVSLLVFSDHGMLDVAEGHDLMAYLKSACHLDAPEHYLPFYDSTMARFWGNRQGVLDQLAARLGRLDYGRIVERRELERLGLAFRDNAYGELVFLLDPGHVILPSFMGRSLPAAMHGYHPEHPHSSGAFMSSGPLKGEPGHIADMMEVMLNALSGVE